MGLQYNARGLQVLAGGAPDLGPDNPLYTLEAANGVAQHHDAVSGTAKQAVTWDYQVQLADGRVAAAASVGASLATLTGYTAGAYVSCELANVTVCPALEAGTQQVLAIYNGLGQARTSVPVRLPVGLPPGVASYAVLDATGAALPAQLLPLSAADVSLRAVYTNDSAATLQWLAFVVPVVPPMGYTTVFLVPKAAAADAPATHASRVVTLRVGGGSGTGVRGGSSGGAATVTGDQVITNGIVSLTISGTTGGLAAFTNTATGVSAPLVQTWAYYNGSTGDAVSSQASGAYIFRPNSSATYPVGPAAATVTLVTGPLVNEARQEVGPWVSQVARLWVNATAAELEWTVGPIDILDWVGKEVIAHYATGWDTNATWHTDANCREMQPRVLNYRPTWTLNVTEPVAGNYYPVNCGIQTADVASGNVLTVVTDRSEGGASLQSGAVELMVHRRLLVDDGRGVGEALNEPQWTWSPIGLIVRGRHWVSVDPAPLATAARVALQQDALFPPTVAYAPLVGTPASWLASFKPVTTGLRAPLPATVHLMTAHSQNATTLLLRLAHLYESSAPAPLAANVTVTLANLFADFTITAATEMTLIANQPAAAVAPVTYNLQGGGSITVPILPPPPAGAALAVTLSPMAIRTFMCTIAQPTHY